jgi:hypothetical protein
VTGIIIIIIIIIIFITLIAGYLQLNTWNNTFLGYTVLPLFCIYNLCYM